VRENFAGLDAKACVIDSRVSMALSFPVAAPSQNGAATVFEVSTRLVH